MDSRSVEPWMVSNVAAGAAQMSFMTLLIPPFITQTTGSAARAGVVLAVVGLAALTGPWIGRFANRRHNHSLLYVLSIFLLSFCFLLLAIDAHATVYSPIIGLLLGVAIAAQGTIGPAFIVGSGQSSDVIAGQLTAFGLSIPVGQLIGALIVAICQFVGLSSEGLFLAAAVTLGIAAVWTWVTINPVAKRLAAYDAVIRTDPKKVKKNHSSVLRSMFGLFLLAATIGAISNNGMTSQIANILPNVYGFTAQQTSLVVALAGLISIGAIVLSGVWMKRIGALPVYLRGANIKFIGMLGMALIGILGGGYLLLAALVVQIAYIGPLITRTASAQVAAVLAPVSASEATGYYLASSALGAFFGSLIAGFLADYVGFNAINWLNAVLGAVAVLILFVYLLPRTKSYKALYITT